MLTKLQVGLLLAMILAVAACGRADGADEELKVVASTSILGDVIANVTGDAATVEVILPLGADPHDYQPSSSQVATMERADLVVVNGLRLEESLIDVIESLEADGALVLEVADQLDPIPFGVDHHDDEGDHDLDPHFWMDPLRVASAARLIASELAAIDPSIDWAANADRYVADLEELDGEIRFILEEVPAPERKMVTNHDSFGYFAARYGFEIIGTVVPGGATLADPSSAQLAELVATMKNEEVDVVFVETTEPDLLARAVAAELGEEVLVVELFTGSLGEPGSGGNSYLAMMKTNAERIAEALA